MRLWRLKVVQTGRWMRRDKEVIGLRCGLAAVYPCHSPSVFNPSHPVYIETWCTGGHCLPFLQQAWWVYTGTNAADSTPNRWAHCAHVNGLPRLQIVSLTKWYTMLHCLTSSWKRLRLCTRQTYL